MKSIIIACSIFCLIGFVKTANAGPISDSCQQQYKQKMVINGLNVTTEHPELGYAVSVSVLDPESHTAEWFSFKIYSESDLQRNALFHIAQSAYIAGESVNVCAGNGYITGIEVVER